MDLKFRIDQGITFHKRRNQIFRLKESRLQHLRVLNFKSRFDHNRISLVHRKQNYFGINILIYRGKIKVKIAWVDITEYSARLISRIERMKMRQRNERLLVFVGDPACPVSVLSIRNLTITVCYLKPILSRLFII